MILVTGCTGFIGTNLVKWLLEHTDEYILGIDKVQSYGGFSWCHEEIGRLHLTYPRFTFVRLDLCDKSGVDWLLSTYAPDRIIHLAAETHVDRSYDDPEGFWSSNVTGTVNLLNAARDCGIKLFINQITDEVYGPKAEGMALEGDAFAPSSPYAASKAAQCLAGRDFFKSFDLPVIQTFPVNTFGPYQYPEKLIPKFAFKLLQGQRVPLMQSTHFQRDWLPVNALCDALYCLLTKGEPGTEYNIGADRHMDNLTLTRMLLIATERDESYIELVADRKNHDCRYAVDSSRIRQLGWTIEHDNMHYLKETVDWYKDRFYLKTKE